MAETDWSQLPKELLNLISQCLNIELDLISFQSTCSTWRSSSIPNHHHILPFKFPLLKSPLSDPINNDKHNTPFCYLSKHSFFLVKPKQQQQQQTLVRPWLMRILQNSSGKTQLLNPLFPNSKISPFPSVLNFNEYSLLHLRTNFIVDTNNQPYGDDDYMYPHEVIAVTCHGKKPLVFGTLSGQCSLLKCGGGSDEDWKVITDISTGDICLFIGRPCVVDETSRAVTVEPDLTVRLVAEPLVGGGQEHAAFLVENEGDLLLLDVYRCFQFGPPTIDLFKLNEKEKEWVKLTNLGDRILFLGFVCSFSISASDLCVAKGNCVIFMDHALYSFGYSLPLPSIWHLDEGRMSRLSDYPEYFNLFWPPPEWIVKSG